MYIHIYIYAFSSCLYIPKSQYWYPCLLNCFRPFFHKTFSLNLQCCFGQCDYSVYFPYLHVNGIYWIKFLLIFGILLNKNKFRIIVLYDFLITKEALWVLIIWYLLYFLLIREYPHTVPDFYCFANQHSNGYPIGRCYWRGWRVDASWISFGKASCWCIDWEGVHQLITPFCIVIPIATLGFIHSPSTAPAGVNLVMLPWKFRLIYGLNK